MQLHLWDKTRPFWEESLGTRSMSLAGVRVKLLHLSLRIQNGSQRLTLELCGAGGYDECHSATKTKTDEVE